ncbi:MAG: hypothetical protein JXN65_01100 [Clostridia bacterium]|nr:hypothetical protein [Clostridia bacterium]
MEITLQHTDAIYKTFFSMAIFIPLFASMPAIGALIKCRYAFAEYKLKDKLLWILPAIALLWILLTTGVYMVEYAFDIKDVQTVYVDAVDRYNGGCHLITERKEFHVGRKGYPEGNISDLMEEEVEGHWCEIESYKASNHVIRIKILD